jgi:iron complex transport system substrate-binding protein
MTHRELVDSPRTRGPVRAASATLLLLTLLAAPATAAQPVRVATLLPYVEDALVRTGGVEIVATVRRDMTTAPAPPILDLGSPHAPSFEKLAEARPQVIVGDRQLHGALRDKLARSGAEVVLVRSDTVDATFVGLLEVGRLCRVEAPMAAQVENARRMLAGLALAQRTPALVIFGTPGSFLVVSNRTWLGDLVSRLNFENVGAAASGQERHPGFVQVSDEVLAGLRPEVVLLVAHGDPEAIRAAFTKRLDGGGPWAGLRAAAVRGVHVLPPALFSQNPGLAVPEAAKVLRDLGAARASAR